MTNHQDPHEHSRRDAESLTMLGIFMIALAIPVLAGTWFADTNHSRIVNVVSGLALLGIGVIFCWRGRKHR